MTNGVRAQGRAHGALLKIFDRGRECSGAKFDRQFVRGLLRVVAFDHAAVFNLAVDGGRLRDAMVEHNRQLLAHILFGERAKAASRFLRQNKVHLIRTWVIRLAVFLHATRLQVASGDDRSAADPPGPRASRRPAEDERVAC